MEPKKEKTQNDDIKEYCKANFSRLHDRFDRIEHIMSAKSNASKKPFYDNADIMRATGLSYRTLQEYRRVKLLITVSDFGPNRYTPQEYERFVYDVAPRGRKLCIKKIDNEYFDFDFEEALFEDK